MIHILSNLAGLGGFVSVVVGGKDVGWNSAGRVCESPPPQRSLAFLGYSRSSSSIWPTSTPEAKIKNLEPHPRLSLKIE